VLQAGDAHGRVFTSPIPTYNITHNFPRNNANATPQFAITTRHGLHYFQNFLHSDMKPIQMRPISRPLPLDVPEMLKRGNALF
ncbi:ribonucleoside triphosphate reductase, partial [Pseudomonas aeruginosa]